MTSASTIFSMISRASSYCGQDLPGSVQVPHPVQ